MSKVEGPTIGIDFGTNFSCVGYWQETHVEIISNPLGNRTTPSLVAFTEEERLIGEEAYNQIHKNPQNTIYAIKRLIGRNFNDEEVQKDIKSFPFKVVEKNSFSAIEIQQGEETKTFQPEEIAAMILDKMRLTAEDYIGQPVKNAVICVPAHFNDLQRQAIKDSAKIAKMEVLRIMNEPTAAALAYGLQKKLKTNGNVLVFDLGGGTFDVTILDLNEGVFQVKTTLGDGHLGGEDFDGRMVNHFIQEFKRKHKQDISDNRRSLRRLRTACEKAKRTLSQAEQSSINVDSLYEGIDFYSQITRARFEDLCADLFKKTIDTVSKAISDAGLTKDQIDEVVIVGGSSKIPKIQQMLTDFFDGKELCKSINPDEAIAFGATIEAAILSGTDHSKITKEVVVVDILPLSLGVESSKGVMTTVIKRKTNIPIKKTMLFSTIQNNQPNVDLKVFQGERLQTKYNKLIGRFGLAISPAPRGIPHIEVTFDVDASGVLQVTAVDKSTNGSDSITITKAKSRLTPQEIEDMIIAAESYRIDDDKFKEKLDVRGELLTFVATTMNMLADPAASSNFSPEEKQMMENATENTMNWLDINSEAPKEAIKQKHDELQAAIGTYISRVTGMEYGQSYQNN